MRLVRRFFVRGFIVIGLCVGLTVGSGFVQTFIRFEAIEIGIAAGCVLVGVPGKVDTQSAVEWTLHRALWVWLPFHWRGLSGYSDSLGNRRTRDVYYCPVVYPCAMVVALMCVVAGRKSKNGNVHCLECGYCLRGNLSGVCPECGRLLRVEESVVRSLAHRSDDGDDAGPPAPASRGA